MKKTLRVTLALVLVAILAMATLSGCAAKKVNWDFENTLDYPVRITYAPDNMDITLQPGEKQTVELTATKSSDRAEFQLESVNDPSLKGTCKTFAILDIGGIFKVFAYAEGTAPTLQQIASNDVLYKG